MKQIQTGHESGAETRMRSLILAGVLKVLMSRESLDGMERDYALFYRADDGHLRLMRSDSYSDLFG